MSAASADEAIATPIAALNNVAPMRRRRARARNSGLVAFIFLVFLISSAVLPDAISDAQNLRATALQSMKWLTEYFAERAMNISALNLRRRLPAEYLACKSSIRPGCPWSQQAELLFVVDAPEIQVCYAAGRLQIKNFRRLRFIVPFLITITSSW